MLPAAVVQPATRDTQVPASERQGDLGSEVKWNSGPQRAGPMVQITGGTIQTIIGKVGLVKKTGRLTQGLWKDSLVYLLRLEGTSGSGGGEVNVVTLQKYTSELDGTQPSLASPAAGAPVLVDPKRVTRRSQGTTASQSAAALHDLSFAAARLQSGARCGYICYIPSRNRN